MAALFGICLLIGITLYGGVGSVTQAIETAGWGMLLIVLARFIQIEASGFAWRIVLPAPIAWWVCPLLRWIREAINVLLPVAQVGGEVVGVRLLTKYGIAGPAAGASVLADLLVQVSTQVLFCLLGLALFFLKSDDPRLVLWLTGGVALFALGVGGFLAVQRGGGVDWIETRLTSLAAANNWNLPSGIVGLSANLAQIHAMPSRLAMAGAIHLAIWLFGASEVWIACHFMGQPLDFAGALVIESLSHAARAVFFVIPGGVGIQESSIVALAATYGLTPPIAVAIGLLKRIPDIILGIIGLLLWQSVELGWLRTKYGMGT
ncbi:lysylphosphatidylglycerol synthase domain-containing protein [Methylovirgula sp. 4M-Z18]|uniref:lysylphosphatidylglycerol synthase domain-containing protein n=1 Tax=Methylovirgula sp. 4M-Z18 TaxID=2293567 RepID=UPI001313F3D3|nr:lysylphosphatidylglycerol synthase domain-containing protein [Methylovirgula sp. 4M-Z18]